MRIGIAAFMHESNTFSDSLTSLQEFYDSSLHLGPALLPVWEEAHHEIGGFIEGCRKTAGVEMLPLLAAWATPSGPLTDECYEHLTRQLVESVRQAQPGGLLLALHGAMASQTHRSADSETLRRVREALGPQRPLVLSLDMHANITPPMIDLPDATIVYRTYPHVDQRARGLECAGLICRRLRGEVTPVQAHRKLPMLIHIVQQFTGDGPMKEVMDEVSRIASRPGMLSASVAPGYIYADTPHLGVSVVAVADDNLELAEHWAERLAHFVWERREQLNAGLPAIPTAVARARTIAGTVCLMDSGDNIGAGGPGDSTEIFHEVRAQGIPHACAILLDPEAAKACETAGTGAKVVLSAGGKSNGKPLHIRGIVKNMHSGQFIETEARHGGARHNDQGLTAVVETEDGHIIVLNSLRIMPTSLQQLLSLGIEPARQKIIIVKGVTAPRAAYEPIASAIIAVDSPGVTQAGPEGFEYHQRPCPLYPLEQDAAGCATWDTWDL